jgi:hypothetical protein
MSSNFSPSHIAVPLELRKSSEVPFPHSLISSRHGPCTENSPSIVAWHRPHSKHISSTVVWRHHACVNVFTEPLPGNASQYSIFCVSIRSLWLEYTFRWPTDKSLLLNCYAKAYSSHQHLGSRQLSWPTCVALCVDLSCDRWLTSHLRAALLCSASVMERI